jgi:hypothetical protein
MNSLNLMIFQLFLVWLSVLPMLVFIHKGEFHLAALSAFVAFICSAGTLKSYIDLKKDK